MPWESFALNDGTSIPSIAYGTWKMGRGDEAVDRIHQAIESGFDHIDTAQAYGNEVRFWCLCIVECVDDVIVLCRKKLDALFASLG